VKRLEFLDEEYLKNFKKDPCTFQLKVWMDIIPEEYHELIKEKAELIRFFCELPPIEEENKRTVKKERLPEEKLGETKKKSAKEIKDF